MIYFVTGAAGFIASNLVARLLEDGHEVIAYDNFSTGQEKFLESVLQNPNFKLIKADLLDEPALNSAIKNVDAVWHLAANADVRFGINHPRKDLQQNTIATSNLLEAMRTNDIRELYFSSTGSVYGESKQIPTTEDAPFPIQTSLYGASKLSCEAMIAAYCEGFQMKARVFRFVSILGEHYTHGHIFDFVNQLKTHPDTLNVLGDGNQRKSYLYVKDCVQAMMTISNDLKASNKNFDIYNLGTDEYCTVKDSISYITARLNLKPKIIFAGGNKGWIGDNPFIYLDTKKIRSLGWTNNLTIQQGIQKPVDGLTQHDWVFKSTASLRT
jgi:UDP-glucose 4-epimerase